MPQNKGVVLDNVTGLYCTSYSTTVSLCQWGNSEDAVLFDTLELAQGAATDMNNQLQTDSRFVGVNPPPR